MQTALLESTGSRVADAMQPLRPTLRAHMTVEAARARLTREGLDFVAVTAGGTGRLLGVVTARSARPGPCCVSRDGRCSIVNHLDEGAAFCFGDEPLAAVLRDEAALAAERGVASRPAPLVVVDHQLHPLGHLPAAAAADAPLPCLVAA